MDDWDKFRSSINTSLLHGINSQAGSQTGTSLFSRRQLQEPSMFSVSSWPGLFQDQNLSCSSSSHQQRGKNDETELATLLQSVDLERNATPSESKPPSRCDSSATVDSGFASCKEGPLVSTGFASFRNIPVVPRLKELLPSTGDGFSNEEVPVNNINRPYSSADHYLDTHFRLVREDFIRPLREAIQEALNKTNGTDDQRPSPSKPLHVYEDATVETMWCLRNRISFLLKFNTSKLGRIDWAVSKRLMFGSLLVLTCDGFKTVHLATVADRNDDMLAKGMVLIKVEWAEEAGARKDEWDMKMWQGNVWTVVESPGYFYACRYVMENLQAINMSELRISRCLLNFQGGDSSRPQYLHNYLALNKEIILPGKLSGDEVVLKFDEHLNASWPHHSILGFDEAQMAAFKAGLSHQLAVIQGPPGTGKTFLGLKVVQTLLMNRCWGQDTPVFVVCYTNHALDQFLEGMLMFTNRVVRIGGRSRSEKLVNFNLGQWLRKNRQGGSKRSRFHSAQQEPMKVLEEKVYEKKMALQRQIEKDLIQQSILLSGAGVLQAKALFPSTESKPQTFSFTSWLSSSQLDWTYFNVTQWLGILNTTPISTEFIESVLQEEKELILKEGGPEVQAVLNSYVEQTDDSRDYTQDLAEEDVLESGPGMVDDENVVYESTAMAGLRMVEDWYEIDDDDDGNFTFYRDNNRNTADRQNRHETNLFELSITKCSDMIAQLQRKMHFLKRDHDQACEEMDKAWKLVNGNSKKFLAVARMQKIFNEEWKEFEGEITAHEQQIAEQKRKIDSLQAVIRLLRVPKGVQLIRPPCGVPDSSVEMNKLSPKDRWLVYRYLVSQVLAKTRDDVAENVPEFVKTVEDHEKLRRQEAVDFLRTVDVVGMTTTAAGRDMARLKSLGPKIVVVEEAAEVFEASIITSLTESCEHLILIGDHKQLRPKPQVYELGVKNKMDVSMFERLVMNNFPHVTLCNQHRMRPEVADLIRPHIYPDLEDDTSVLNYEHVPGVCKDVFFITHSNKEKKDWETKSPENVAEVDFILALCQYLLQQGLDPSKITILSPYSRQVFRFSQNRTNYPSTADVKITTVDNFQGEENDVILLSLVRCNDKNEVGFLAIANRINVALSRAKRGLFIMGDLNALTKKSQIWREVAAKLKKKDAVGNSFPLSCVTHKNAFHVKTAADFATGGDCGQVCGLTIKPCGHKCTRLCHAFDRDHHTSVTSCQEVVMKMCSRGLHLMNYVCGQSALGQCMKATAGNLPCGHQHFPVPCYCLEAGASLANIAMKIPACQFTCGGKHLLCGHPCKLLCGHILEDAVESKSPVLQTGTFHDLREHIHSGLCPLCTLKRDIKATNVYERRNELDGLVAAIWGEKEESKERLERLVKRNRPAHRGMRRFQSFRK